MSMKPISALVHDRSGNVMMFFAFSLTILLGVSGLAVDAGTFFLQKRTLQGIADAAALSAANTIGSPRDGASAAIGANGGGDVTIDIIETGTYVADPALAADARFDPEGATEDAVRVRLSRSVPMFFGRFLTGKPTAIITAQATAARIDLAAFSLGSRLASVEGGLPNALLSGLAGTELSLSVMDYNALVSGQVDVLRFAEALRTTASLDVASFGEVLASDVTLPQIAEALAAATTDPIAAAVLDRIAPRLPADRLAVSRAIDLGPLSSEVRADPAHAIQVDAYAILQAVLEVGGRNRYVESTVNLVLPGIASSKLMLAIGDRAQNSPWLAVGAAGDVTLRTAQTRLYLDSTVSALGLGTVRLPVFIELAQATATLTDVSCAGGRAQSSVSLAVTPAVGEVAIADFDPGAFADFQSAPVLRPATIIRMPLATVTAGADITLGGVSPQAVTFSSADISNRRIKSVATNDLVHGVATSLIQRLTVNVAGLGGLGLPIGGSAAIGTALGSVATPLDSLINQVTALVGVRVGQADVRVNGVRCGTPRLVG